MGKKSKRGRKNNTKNNSNATTSSGTTLAIPEAAAGTSTAQASTTSTDIAAENEKRKRAQHMLVHFVAFPRCNYFNTGRRFSNSNLMKLALDAYKNGMENDGCVPCIVFYVNEYIKRHPKMLHLMLPWCLEVAIRGCSFSCMEMLLACYVNSKPVSALALHNYWTKVSQSFQSPIFGMTKEKRKDCKKTLGDQCIVCLKKDSDEGNVSLLFQCKGCMYYSYCSEDCQRKHWKDPKNKYNHRAECKHLQILNKYHKPYYRKIHQAIIDGTDPKSIPELQTLRTKVGLNRPNEEYQELSSFLEDDNNYDNRCKYHIARKDGTVHIGSTENRI